MKPEVIISGVLRAGVWASMGLIAGGSVLRFASGGAAASAALTAGLALLIVTPVLRVGTALVLFALERDGTYVCITAVVLLVLALAFVTGNAG